MKKFSFFFIFASVCFFLSSCEKMQDAKVTFYVSNAGSAQVWGHIKVEIGGKTGAFFTPESSNMTLESCDGHPNSITFYLPAGTYSYDADNGSWTGSVTVDNGDCKIIKLMY